MSLFVRRNTLNVTTLFGISKICLICITLYKRNGIIYNVV